MSTPMHLDTTTPLGAATLECNCSCDFRVNNRKRTFCWGKWALLKGLKGVLTNLLSPKILPSWRYFDRREGLEDL